jgi:S1-C subfamily serine protease
MGLGPRAKAEDLSSEDLYDKVVNSCVFIITPLKGGFAMGSGSLVDSEKRYVITNYHVVEDKDFVFAQFPIYVKGKRITDKKTYIENVPAGKAIKAKVLHRDKGRDLAVIQLEKIPPGTKAIVLAKDSPRVGSTTFNIGSPGAVEQLFSITEGKVRSVGTEDHLVGDGTVEGTFRVKAVMVTATNPTNPGDSGGPLFNKKGEQVAVTESGHRSAQNVNLFVDISEVRAFLNEKKLTIKESGIEPKKEETAKKDPKKDNGGSETTAKDPAPPPKADTTPAASEADEKAAAARLASAKLFKDGDENREVYKSKLNAIIKQYPNTAAGKEAKNLLDALK